MTVRFRNLNVTPDDPVESWGDEGIQTALERGGLLEWRRITKAVLSDPWGEVASCLEEVLSYSDPYGIGRLMRQMLASARGVPVHTIPGDHLEPPLDPF